MPKIEFPDELLCPITNLIIKDPAVIKDDPTKTVYERGELVNHFAKHKTNPVTNDPLVNPQIVWDGGYVNRMKLFMVEHQIASPVTIFAAVKTGKLSEVKTLNYTENSFDIFDSDGRTLLEVAAEKGSLELFEFIYNETTLKKHITADKGLGAIHFATQAGQEDIVKFLSSKDPESIKARTANGDNLVHLAAAYGRDKLLPVLQVKGIPIDQPNNDGMTPCILAALYGHGPAMDFFIKQNVRLNRRDDSGCNAMMRAAYAGKSDIVSKLLMANADVLGKDEFSALHCAADAGHIDIACLILTANPHWLNHQDARGDTPLHYAARQNRLDMVTYLLSQDNVVLRFNRVSKSPLHVALEGAAGTPYRLILDALFKKFPSLLTENDGLGRSILFVAVMFHYSYKAVEYLILKNNSLVNRPSSQDFNNTPLHVASAQEKKGIVELLLSHGADPEAKNIDEFTAYDATESSVIKEVITNFINEQKRQRLALPFKVKALEAEVLNLKEDNEELRRALKNLETQFQKFSQPDKAPGHSPRLFSTAIESAALRAPVGDLLMMDMDMKDSAEQETKRKESKI